MAATLDVISGGRLIYSLGSAWFEAESSSYGLPWDDHDARVARLGEALHIAKALWTQDEASFDGRFYTLERACLEPKPVQQPHIPIWVPGDSEASRQLAAEIGDVWLTYSKPPAVIAGWVDDMTRRRAGKRLPMAISTVSLTGLGPAELERWSMLYAKEREHRFATPPTPQDVLRENLSGTVEQCVERLRQYESLGVEHLIIQPIPPLEGMRHFAQHIMPALATRSSSARAV
jgi:FMNH2-dependent dimethyl sulfone monooxygenase